MKMTMVNRAFTGHTYFRSPYECYDSCSTCDGAKCERCRERWEVHGWDTENPNISLYNTFSAKEVAQEFADAWEKREM